uniref:Uncharacterized protein n=1 Tax=Megaselia scalaris TaxID=36166 RepID=T1H1I5_MEGSC
MFLNLHRELNHQPSMSGAHQQMTMILPLLIVFKLQSLKKLSLENVRRSLKLTVLKKDSVVVQMVRQLHKVHSTRDVQLLRHVRIQNMDVVQMEYHQLKDLRIRVVQNHNVLKHSMDVVLTNTHLLKEMTTKDVQFQQLSHQLLPKKLIPQLLHLVKMIQLLNLEFRNHALSMNLDVALTVRHQLKDLNSRVVMEYMMKRTAIILSTAVVTMEKLQLPLLIRKIVLHVLKSHLDVAQMVPHQLTDTMEKDVVAFMNLDVVKIILLQLVVQALKYHKKN